LLKDIGASCKNLYNYEDVEIDEDGIEIQVEETRVTGCGWESDLVTRYIFWEDLVEWFFRGIKSNPE